METRAEIRFSLVLLISFFLHVVAMTALMLPDFAGIASRKSVERRLFGGRDVIVNINEDERKVTDRSTLLSEKDSAAKGHLSREKGDHWLNNSLDFRLRQGKARLGRTASRSADIRSESALLLAENTEVVISLLKQDFGSVLGEEGDREFTTIPDKNSFSRKNAIFYSSDGRFSFNTMKFKNFRYFREMKDKIASHWFPPLLANSVIRGYDPVTSAYTPGRLRIMAIPNQEVKLYFTMDRAGTVLDIVIVDSMGNRPLDSSCTEAVRLSKNFGKVPDDIQGKVIVIPFVFGYYIY
ncbi:MAG: energy transducer TonB [Spirochaetes bacterium]|nr:energy transducer TonB [Spirochaetota bacterium]